MAGPPPEVTAGRPAVCPQRAAGAGSPAALHSVVEELVRFRQTVRRFALAAGEAAGEARRRQLLERRALLEACDALRRDLSAHGVRIKVSAAPGAEAGSRRGARRRPCAWTRTGPDPRPDPCPLQWEAACPALAPFCSPGPPSAPQDRSDVSTWELLDPRTEDPKAGR